MTLKTLIPEPRKPGRPKVPGTTLNLSPKLSKEAIAWLNDQPEKNSAIVSQVIETEVDRSSGRLNLWTLILFKILKLI